MVKTYYALQVESNIYCADEPDIQIIAKSTKRHIKKMKDDMAEHVHNKTHDENKKLYYRAKPPKAISTKIICNSDLTAAVIICCATTKIRESWYSLPKKLTFINESTQAVHTKLSNYHLLSNTMQLLFESKSEAFRQAAAIERFMRQDDTTSELKITLIVRKVTQSTIEPYAFTLEGNI